MEHHTYLTTYPLRQDYCQTIYGTPHISDYVSFANGLLSNKLWNTTHIWLRILCDRTTVKQSMEHLTYLTTYPLLQDYCQTNYGTPHISDYVSFATGLLSNKLWNTTHIWLRILCYRTTVKQSMEHLTYLTTYPLRHDYCQTIYGTPHISDYVSFATGLLSNNLWNTTHIWLRILCYTTTVKQTMEHHTYLTTYPLLQDYCQTNYGTPHISDYVSFATGLLSNKLWNTSHIWLRILCYTTTVKQSMEHLTYLTTYPLRQDYCQTNYGTSHISHYVSFATGLLSNKLWNTSHIWLRILCDRTTVKQSMEHHTYLTTYPLLQDYCQTIYGTPHISDYVSFATGLLSNNLWNTTHIWLRILWDTTTVKQSMEHHTYLTTYPLLQDYCQTIYGTPHISDYVSFATGLLSNNLWNTTHIWLRILWDTTTVKQSMEHHTYLTTYPLLQDYCQTNYGTPHISDYVSFATGLLSNKLWNTTHISLRILWDTTTVKQSMEHHTYLTTYPLLQDYCQTNYGTPHISDYVSFATGLLSNNLWNTTHIWLRILCDRTTVKQSMEHHTYLTTYPLLQDYCQTIYGTPHISDYVSFATGLLSNNLWNTSHIWLRILCYRTTVKQSMEHLTYLTTYPLLQDYCQTNYGTPHISDYVSFATRLLSNNLWNTSHIWLRILCDTTTVKQSMEHLTYLTTYPLLMDYCQTNYGTPHISDYVSFATGLLSNNLWNTSHIWLRILCYRTTVKQTMEHHTYLTTYPLRQDYCQTNYGTPHISDYVSFATGLLSNNLWNTSHIWLRILCDTTTVKQSMEHHTYLTTYPLLQDYCQTIYGTPHISDYVSFATRLLSNKLWNTTHIWLRILCYRTTVKQTMEHHTYLTTYPLLQDYCQTNYGTPHTSDYVSFATRLLSNNLWNTSHIWLRIHCDRTTVKQTMEHHTYLTTYPLLQDYCQTNYGTSHISDYVSFATGLLSNNLWNTSHISLRILCDRTTVKQSMEHHTYLTTYPLLQDYCQTIYGTPHISDYVSFATGLLSNNLWNTTHIWLRILCYRTTVKQSMEHLTYLTTYPLLQDYCQTIYGTPHISHYVSFATRLLSNNLWNTTHISLRILWDTTTVKQAMEHLTYLTTYPLGHDYCQTIYGTPHISDYVSFATRLLSNNLWNTTHISLRILWDTTTVKQSMEHHTYLTTNPLRHDYCQTIYGTPHISDYESFGTRLLSNNLWNTTHIWLRILWDTTTVKQSMEHHRLFDSSPVAKDT